MKKLIILAAAISGLYLTACSVSTDSKATIDCNAPAQTVYVLGKVAKPGEVRSHSTITLARALACAEIDMNRADTMRVIIKNGSNSKVSIVNFKEILTSDKPDVELENGDTVYVKENVF